MLRVKTFDSDAGIAHLKGLKGLQRLRLSGTAVTDAGLAHLKGLSNLEHLFLDGAQITDARLPHLMGLSLLRHAGYRRRRGGPDKAAPAGTA